MNEEKRRPMPCGNRVDFHTHILPGADDGSKSPEESVSMLRTLAEAGVGYVVLSPHFYAGGDRPEAFLARRERALGRLRETLASVTDFPVPALIVGAEVEYFAGISAMDMLPAFRLGDSPCLLLEMPYGRWLPHILDDVIGLCRRGDCRVVLAHVERYLFEQKPETVQMLLENGVVMQSNAAYFLGRMTSGRAVRMLRRGWIHLLGSDCHDTVMRPPNLGDACGKIARRLGEDTVDGMMQDARRLLCIEKI